MSLTYTQITGTFNDGQGNPLSGSATFTPNTTVYAAGIPVVEAGVPIAAQITAGSLKSASGGTLQLLSTDNSGLTYAGQTGFLFWTVTVTVSGQLLAPWSFFLPHTPSPVDLFALANTGAGGGGGGFTNPMTTLGDLIDGGASGAAARLAGDTSNTRKFLRAQASGGVAQAPAWDTLQAGDVPVLNQNTTGTAANITGTLDQVPAPAANVSLAGHKVTSLANGSAGTDAAAYGQTPAGGSTVTIGQGGTGQATQQAALDALAGASTSGQVLRGNGTHVLLAAIVAGDVPTLNQNTTGTAANLAGGATLPAYLAPKVVTLTFAGSGTTLVDASAGNAFNLTLTASTTTLGNPSNSVDGEVVRFRITQGSGGSFTLAYGTAYDFGTSGAPALSTAAGKVDILGFEYVASLSKWCYLGSGLGY